MLNGTQITSLMIAPTQSGWRKLGQRGWVAVTHDGRIRYKPNELAAVVQHRVALLVVIGHAPYPQLARTFAATKDRIPVFLEQHDPPFIAKIYRPPANETALNPGAPGRIELWFPR